MDIIKAHAYGNDFLFVSEDSSSGSGLERAEMARSLCERHTGVGADGLVFYRCTPSGATMELFNADGSMAEVSGNAVRCLAMIVLRGISNRGSITGMPRDIDRPVQKVGSEVIVETGAGKVTLTLLEIVGRRYTFCARMGNPRDIQLRDLKVGGENVRVVTLSVGNPQCVVIDSQLDEKRFYRLGPGLSEHEAFPAGTNVEFTEVETPTRIRILIWERGVGPTEASGTGACAAAVAAAKFGGALREVDVVSPGGIQKVAWRDDGLWLTGWAEVTLECPWPTG